MIVSKRLLWRSYLAVASIATVFFMWQCHSDVVVSRPLAKAAAEHFHDEFNHGEYREIFDQADYGFTYDKTETELAKDLQKIRTEMGTVGHSELVGIRVDRTTDRRFVTAEYSTSFARGNADETFTWSKVGDTLKLYRYRFTLLQGPR